MVWLFRNSLKKCFFNMLIDPIIHFKYGALFMSKFVHFKRNYSLLTTSALTFTCITSFYLRKVIKNNKINRITKLTHEELESLFSNSKRNLLILQVGKKTNLKKAEVKEELKKLTCSKIFDKLNINLYYMEKEESENTGIISISMYNGHSKNEINICKLTNKNITNDIVKFFTPISENIKSSEKDLVKNISYDNFEAEIIRGSSKKNPVLLMYYEQYCLMCFLIRPLFNSIASELRETSMQFARINIDKNHLHDFSPNINATPTFVLYRGKEKPEKWDEYKPIDIIKKISDYLSTKEMKNIISYKFPSLEDLETKIYIRFQLFTLLILWNLLLIDIQNLLSTTPSNKEIELICNSIDNLHLVTSNILNKSSKNSNFSINTEDVNFESILNQNNLSEHPKFKEVLTSNISSDMKKSDNLEENIKQLLSEIEEISTDCLALKSLLQ